VTSAAAAAVGSISVDGVGRTFADGTVALRDARFEIRGGEITALVGPSGCGKTTLMRMIGGLDSPSEGRIVFGAPPATCTALATSPGPAASAPAVARAPRTAFAFQEPRLLPWRSVLANVALPLELAGVPRAERLARAQSMLERVRLPAVARKLPGQLSGGMRMRAAIARALVTEPELLLLDEPFGALDEITRQALDDMLLALQAELRMTTLVITHSIVEAAYLGDRVVVMAPAPGRVVEVVEPRFAARTPALRASPEFAAVTARLLQQLGSAMVAAGGDR
jgi:NitT/TauT family transport system ATP-binding protein